MLHCFHCDLEIDPAIDISVSVLGKSQPMCCNGCAAVATAIVDAHLESYYTHRTEKPRQGEQLVPEQLRELTLYDHPDIQKSFVHSTDEHIQEASLILEGITCAACVWLNQQHLSGLEGVVSVDINYTSLKAVVRWDQRKIKLSDILKAIQLIGYTAHPYDPSQRQYILEKSRKDILRRLGVAGGFGMQVMAVSVSLYLDQGGMDPGIKLLLQRSAFILTLPVIFYAARPFFQGALADFKRRHPGMDTPVAIGIGLAFAASVYTLISGRGEIYFDSVCMFTFLLLGARYLEITARKRASDSADLASRVRPVLARKLKPDGNIEMIAALELVAGDRVLVHAGDTVPADGHIRSGESSLNEAILTGESLPKLKSVHDSVIGGSINIDSPITVEISRTGSQTVLSGIQRLLDNAQQAKPAIAQLADQIAGWFVFGILTLASITGLVWFNAEPEHWLAPTIAVLIVSCPCALSLATPSSITTAIGRLMNSGIVISNKNALETLHKIKIMFLDKTGTLTEGKLKISAHTLLDDAYAGRHFDICSAIEQYSEHPVARAFVKEYDTLQAQSVQNTPGRGMSGIIDGKNYSIGTPAFIFEQTGQTLDDTIKTEYAKQTVVLLATVDTLIAVYALSDTIRPEAHLMVEALKHRGIQPVMLTGDNEQAAQAVASQLGIKKIYAGQLPSDKLAVMKRYQQNNGKPQMVGMVGDGVNDAAVLAGADCSIATQGAAALASAGSDVLLLTPKLDAINTAIDVAHKTHAVIRQNLIWAASYNLLAIPAAAMGYVPPWAAAIGMSLSSLLVVLNALRLKNS